MLIPEPVAFNDQELSENEERFLRLVEAVAGGQTLALVGAGSSISAGYPSWASLLEGLALVAERCTPGFVALLPAQDNLAQAQAIREWIVKATSLEHFQSELGKLFVRAPKPTPFHDDLLAIPFRGFATTNYDTTLQTAAVRSGRVASRPIAVPVWNGEPRLVGRALRALTDGGSLEYVIHLHGLCGEALGEAQPHTIVLARADYEAAYGIDLPGRVRAASGSAEPHRLRMVISSLLLTRRLVFVGFSLDDPFVTEVLLRSVDMAWSWDQSDHFAIVPISADTATADRAKAERLRRDLAIESVFYEVKDGDHSERDALFRRLRRVVTPTPPIAPVAPDHSPGHPTPPGPPAALSWVAATNRVHQKKAEGT